MTEKINNDLIEAMDNNQVRIIVIRHGEGIHNIKGIMTSSRSPGVYLTENGMEQVKKAADELQMQGIEYVYSSPLYRTMQKAQILGMGLNIPHEKMVVDDRLREQSFGDCEGYTWEEYEKIFPPLDTFEAAAPNGESGLEVFARTEGFLWQIVRKHRVRQY